MNNKLFFLTHTHTHLLIYLQKYLLYYAIINVNINSLSIKFYTFSMNIIINNNKLFNDKYLSLYNNNNSKSLSIFFIQFVFLDDKFLNKTITKIIINVIFINKYVRVLRLGCRKVSFF